jgi:hypothetical protein
METYPPLLQIPLDRHNSRVKNAMPFPYCLPVLSVSLPESAVSLFLGQCAALCALRVSLANPLCNSDPSRTSRRISLNPNYSRAKATPEWGLKMQSLYSVQSVANLSSDLPGTSPSPPILLYTTTLYINVGLQAFSRLPLPATCSHTTADGEEIDCAKGGGGVRLANRRSGPVQPLRRHRREAHDGVPTGTSQGQGFPGVEARV